MATTTLQQHVEEWLRLDQNPETRAEVERLWAEQNLDELKLRMSTRIEFGTAGLRGKMEAGWARMNDLTVIQASQGLAEYVAAKVKDALSRGIVIGYDHRYHSKDWALLTAAAFLKRGYKVYLYGELVHTPLVPFGVKHLNAACGVMITASHNPKQDNGYKVYWENAVQIIPPHDEGIAESIKVNLVPSDGAWTTSGLEETGRLLDVTKEVQDAYFEAIKNYEHLSWKSPTSSAQFVNSSMHGVSDPYVRRGFDVTREWHQFVPVAEQQLPDPEFPTVLFPNPEEKGALDLAIETANREGFKYLMAQDPDGDRFCGAEKQDSGEWFIFSGDQLGCLFAYHILEKRRWKERTDFSKMAMVSSTVSSKMLESMAEVEGFKYVETLTGFKYIGNAALELVEQGYEVPFGYEEAIGYMFGPDLRDKDGVAAAVSFVDMVHQIRGDVITVYHRLQQLYRWYGHFRSNNGYFVCREPAKIEAIFHRLRNFVDGEKDRSFPTSLGNLPIVSVVDLTLGYDSRNAPSYKPTLPLSGGQMLQFRAGEKEDPVKLSLTIRTSGTEPKIKFYLEGSGKMKKPDEILKVLEIAFEELGEVWMEAEKNGLPLVRT